jgi:hypothetical protein
MRTDYRSPGSSTDAFSLDMWKASLMPIAKYPAVSGTHTGTVTDAPFFARLGSVLGSLPVCVLRSLVGADMAGMGFALQRYRSRKLAPPPPPPPPPASPKKAPPSLPLSTPTTEGEPPADTEEPEAPVEQEAQWELGEWTDCFCVMYKTALMIFNREGGMRLESVLLHIKSSQHDEAKCMACVVQLTPCSDVQVPLWRVLPTSLGPLTEEDSASISPSDTVRQILTQIMYRREH